MKRQNILYSGLFLLLIHFYVMISDLVNFGKNFENILLFSGLFLLILSSYSKKGENLFTKTIFLILAILSYFLSRQSDILQFGIILVSLQNEDIKKIINFTFKISLTVLVAHIFLYFILYTYNSAIIHFNIRNKLDGVELRHTFLFTHSNIFSAIVCWCYLAALYLEKNKTILGKIITFLLSFILILFFSKTRTVIVIILTTILILNYFDKFGSGLKKLIKYSPILIPILFTLFLVFYQKLPIISLLDSLLEARIKLGYVAYKRYGISMFGQFIDYSLNDTFFWGYGLSSSGFTIDSTYYKMIFSNGIVNYVMFLIYIFLKCNKRNCNDKDNCFLLSYSLFAAVESFGFYPLLAFPVLLLANSSQNNVKR